jgi:hypothetical protein
LIEIFHQVYPLIVDLCFLEEGDGTKPGSSRRGYVFKTNNKTIVKEIESTYLEGLLPRDFFEFDASFEWC